MGRVLETQRRSGRTHDRSLDVECGQADTLIVRVHLTIHYAKPGCRRALCFLHPI